MKGKISPHAFGMMFGAFLGLVHAGWALLVATGLAQGLLDWIFGLHFLRNPYMVYPFELGTAVMLVIVTSVVGYVGGWVLGSLWNWAVKK